nr:hypothetical protein [uncultured bacterium]
MPRYEQLGRRKQASTAFRSNAPSLPIIRGNFNVSQDADGDDFGLAVVNLSHELNNEVKLVICKADPGDDSSSLKRIQVYEDAIPAWVFALQVKGFAVYPGRHQEDHVKGLQDIHGEATSQQVHQDVGITGDDPAFRFQGWLIPKEECPRRLPPLDRGSSWIAFQRSP